MNQLEFPKFKVEFYGKSLAGSGKNNPAKKVLGQILGTLYPTVPEREAILEEAIELAGQKKSKGVNSTATNLPKNGTGEEQYTWCFYYWLHVHHPELEALEDVDLLLLGDKFEAVVGRPVVLVDADAIYTEQQKMYETAASGHDRIVTDDAPGMQLPAQFSNRQSVEDREDEPEGRPLDETPPEAENSENASSPQPPGSRDSIDRSKILRPLDDFVTSEAKNASGKPLLTTRHLFISKWTRLALPLFVGLLLVTSSMIFGYNQWQAYRELHATYPELASALENKLDDLRGTGKLTSREFAEEYVRLGSYYSVFDLDQSQAALRDALAHEPSLPSAHLGLANNYKERGLIKEAVSHFEKAANSDFKDDPLQVAAISFAKMLLAVRRFDHKAAVEFAYEADRALQLHNDDEFRLGARMSLATVLALDGDLKGGARLLADAVRDCNEVKFPRLLAYCRQMDFLHVKEGTSYNEVRRMKTDIAEQFRKVGAPIQAIRLDSERLLPPLDFSSPAKAKKWAESNFNEARRAGAKALELNALRQKARYESALYKDNLAAFAIMKTVIADIDTVFELQIKREVLSEGATYAAYANNLRQALDWVQERYSIAQSIQHTEEYLSDLFWMTTLSEAIGDTETANRYWMQLEKQVALQLPDGGQSAQLIRLASPPFPSEYPGLKSVLKRIIAFAENEQDAESAEAARKLLLPNEKAD